MGWLLRCCAVLLCLWSGWASAVIELDENRNSHSAAPAISYLRDDSHRLQLADVLGRSDWINNGFHVFNQGYSSATWWLRFDVHNPNPQLNRQLLEIAYPVLDEIEVWELAGGQVQNHYLLGDKLPFHERPVDNRNFLLPLSLQADAGVTMVLRVRTSSSVQVPLTLWEYQAYFDNDQVRMLGQGIYFGTMFVMAFYNLFVFLLVGDRNYLYYVLYVLSMPLFLASLNGLAFQFLWPGATTWNDQAIIESLAGVVLFGTLFTNRFLQLKEYLPWLMMPLWGLCISCVLIMGAAMIWPYAVMIHIMIGVAVGGCVAALAASLLRWRQGDSSARFYAIAWSAMLLGGIVLALNKLHILPQNPFTENATQFGSALEVILLSFALAERINVERRLRFEAQQETLAAQQETLFAQRQANETLEQRVLERTEALEEANRKLAEMSATDQLTGLKNRRHLDKVLQDEYVRCFRYKHPIAVLLMDIDHFKRFNDTYGHLVGDDCLRCVAKALLDAVRRPMDQICRYGGEEFCVVLPETDVGGARTVAERVRATVEKMVFEVSGQHVPVTISIGVAVQVPLDAESCSQLVALADQALYQSKDAGRNCVSVV